MYYKIIYLVDPKGVLSAAPGCTVHADAPATDCSPGR